MMNNHYNKEGINHALYYLVSEDSQTSNKGELFSLVETHLSEGDGNRLLLLLDVVLEDDAPEL